MNNPEGTTGSLNGLRVVDLSRVLAGPLCTQMLADHGAEVIKVEPPSGDESRFWGPPFISGSMSAYYGALNRNKKNISVNLSEEEGQVILRDILASADVLVENFKAGTLASWGFSDEQIREEFPQLIHCRITGFGQDGPMGGLPGYDAMAQAYGGLMSINGEPDSGPLRVGVPIVDMVTGIYAFSGILLALTSRQHTGLGQLVECTLIDTAVSLLHPHSASHLADGRVPARTGSAHPTIAPYDVFSAADGDIFIGAGNDRQFSRLVEALGVPDLVADERFSTNADRVENVTALKPLLTEQIGTWKNRELSTALVTKGVPASPVHNVAEVLSDPHVIHRGMVQEFEGHQRIGLPITLADTPGSIQTPPQEQGANVHHVLSSIGYSPERISELLDSNTVHINQSE